MFGNPAAERAALELSYEATADITRLCSVIPEGKHTAEMQPTAIAAGVRCGLSYGGNNSRQDDEAQQTVDHDATLYLPPEIGVQAGDTVTVLRYGQTSTYEAVGHPALYATHQEVALKEGGVA